MIVLNGEIKMKCPECGNEELKYYHTGVYYCTKCDEYVRVIPKNIQEGIDFFVLHGGDSHLGSFVRAVLENNLREAFGQADLTSREYLFEIMQYCYNEIPTTCWGSKENVEAWQGELR